MWAEFEPRFVGIIVVFEKQDGRVVAARGSRINMSRSAYQGDFIGLVLVECRIKQATPALTLAHVHVHIPSASLLPARHVHSTSLVRLCEPVSAFGLGHPLRERLVSAAAVVLGAVGEEPVDDHAADGEEEDDQAPGQLVQGRAVGLEDLDWEE